MDKADAELNTDTLVCLMKGRCSKCGGVGTVRVTAEEIQSLNGYIAQSKRKVRRGFPAGKQNKRTKSTRTSQRPG